MPESGKRCWQEIGSAGRGDCERLREIIHCRNCIEYSRAGRELFDRPVPTGLVAEWTAALAAENQDLRREALSVVIFRVCGEWFALRTAVFAEVTEKHAPHSVPFRSSGAFLGLVNVSGELLLCVSLAQLLGISGDDGPEPVRPRICVIAQDHERVAFPVDEVLGVRRLDESALAPTPATVSQSPGALTSSMFEYDGRGVGLLDEEKLFAALARCMSW